MAKSLSSVLKEEVTLIFFFLKVSKKPAALLHIYGLIQKLERLKADIEAGKVA